LQLILSKLEALETKFDTVVAAVNNWTSTVEGLKKLERWTKYKEQWRLLKARQPNLGRALTKCRDGSLSFLNKEIQELRSNSNKLEWIENLESKILYLEV
jgi:prefoldin subunit 5